MKLPFRHLHHHFVAMVCSHFRVLARLALVLLSGQIMALAATEAPASPIATDTATKTPEAMEAEVRHLMMSGQLAKAVPAATELRTYFEAHPNPAGDEAAARAYALSAYLQLIALSKPSPESDAWFARAQAELDLLGKTKAPITQAELDGFRAFNLVRSGRMEEGQALALATYRTQEKLSGVESERALNALQILSTSYLLNGQYREAQPYARRLVAWLEKKRPDSVATAIAYNNLCAIALTLGQTSQARPLLEKTVRLLEANLGPDHPNVALTRNNLALFLKNERDFAGALVLYEKSRDPLLRALPPGHPNRGRFLNSYGMVLAEVGRFGEAAKILADGEVELEKSFGPKSRELATNFAYQARSRLLSGDAASALPLADRAVTMLPDDAYGLDVVIEVQELRLQILLALGDHPAARAQAASLQANRLALLREQLSFTSENERLSSLRFSQPFDAVASTGEADLIAAAVLRMKGLVIEAMLEDETLARRSTDPEITDLLARLRKPAKQEASSQPGAGDISSAQELLEQELARKVTSLGVSRRALEVRPEDISSALDAHEALVEYIAYRQWLPTGKNIPSYGALVLTRNAAPRWIRLGEAAPIEQAVIRYEQYVRDNGSDTWLAQLRTLTVDPVLATLPAGIQKIYFSPDASLHAVSFAALPLADGTFLAEKYIVASVNSGRDLQFTSKEKTLVTGEAVGLANPAFATSLHLPSLQNSVGETEALLHFAGKNHPARLLTGADATSVNLRALKSPYVLHLATHGFSPETDAENPAAALNAYLALSGTDRLTAADASLLDLQDTWLTTLAACDSGRGSVAEGEGLLGLRRGFLRAGTRHLALALWRLPDDATTQRLLTDFYADVFAGKSPEDALHHAQTQQLRLLAAREGTGPAIRKAGSLIVVLRR